MKVELQQWQTPNFVRIKMPPRRREDGFREDPCFSLKELEVQDLSNQCDKFRAEIFEKAGKVDPYRSIIEIFFGNCGNICSDIQDNNDGTYSFKTTNGKEKLKHTIRTEEIL